MAVLRVALTGGIATGKSYVLDRLAERSIPTVDADQVSRDVVRPGEPASRAIREHFGPTVFRADGELDRERLARCVFEDEGERAALEAIVHPRVRSAIDRWFEQVVREGCSSFAVAGIPLLYETGRDGDFDRVIVTSCEPSIQLERLAARDGMAESDALKRLAAQLPTAEKVARADFVIQTDGSFEDTDIQIDAVCEQLASQ